MLQQTQVDTVIPYYQRFLLRFPTLETLAKAPYQKVLKAWENLGYYVRARHLHEAAIKVLNEMEGEVPDSREKLMALPGIGSYTASAILSIAFGQRVPAVDGNVKRVMCRLFALHGPIDQKEIQDQIYTLANDLVPAGDPGAFNQAMMELGATVCIPRRPSCHDCPVQNVCLAFLKGIQATLPVLGKKNRIPHRHMTAAIIRDGKGRLLIVQRLENGLLGGLWKFPGGMCQPEEDPEKGLRRTMQEELGLRISVGERVTSVRHAYSHFRVTLHAYRCDGLRARPKALSCREWRWVVQAHLSRFPFSKVDRQIIKAL